MDINYTRKYLKYKNKYLKLKYIQKGGTGLYIHNRPVGDVQRETALRNTPDDDRKYVIKPHVILVQNEFVTVVITSNGYASINKNSTSGWVNMKYLTKINLPQSFTHNRPVGDLQSDTALRTDPDDSLQYVLKPII